MKPCNQVAKPLKVFVGAAPKRNFQRAEDLGGGAPQGSRDETVAEGPGSSGSAPLALRPALSTHHGEIWGVPAPPRLGATVIDTLTL